MPPDLPSPAPRPRGVLLLVGAWAPRAFFLACLTLYLAAAWWRTDVQNLYARFSVDRVWAVPPGSLWDHLAFCAGSIYYPPVYDWLVVLATALVGPDLRAVIRTLAVLPLLAALGVLVLYRARGRPGLGLFAAGTFLLLPVAWKAAVFPGMDAALAVFLVAAFASLTRGADGPRPPFDILAGVLLGLGMMTKWTFCLFAGPWAAYEALFGYEPRGRAAWVRQRARLLRIAVPFLLVAGPWYALQLDWPGLLGSAGNEPNTADGRFGTAALLRIGEAVLGRPTFLAAALALVLVAGLVWRAPARARAFGLLALLAPTVAVSFLPHLEPRHVAAVAASLLLAPAYLPAGRAARALGAAVVGGALAASLAFNVLPDLARVRAIARDPGNARAAWFDPAAERAMAWLAELAAREPRLVREGLTNHPLYRSRLAPPEESLAPLLFRAGRIPLHPRLGVEYAEFVQELREGRELVQFLLTTCRAAEECRRDTGQEYAYLAWATDPAGRPYIQPGRGTFRPVGEEPLGADWPFIERRFLLMDSARIGSETWYLWKRAAGVDASAAPGMRGPGGATMVSGGVAR